ncbi:MAG: aminopeptidase [Bacilli bacterium]|nr:aminopeptidase [Bacilli bacterium]
MKKSTLKKYAHLIAKVGGNVQKGQNVELYVAVDQEELANYIVEECYKLGANTVAVRWTSDKVEKTTLKKESIKSLSHFYDYELAKQQYLCDELPVMIHIESSDPDAMKGVNQAKVAKVRMAQYPVIKPYRDKRENKYQWTIAGASSPAWAKKVFPNLSKKKAVEALWDAILKTSRCDEDPIKAWEEHNADLAKRTKYLNSLNLDYLHYTSKNGTDFKVWLLPNVDWLAGGEKTLGRHVFFNPNIPSEECFTSPAKGKAEGIVYSTKPLSYQGELIENFSIRFEKGKAVEVHAEKGEKLLKHMISMDENARYLGECALVPYDSPINNTGILFYNTLYDENAACHLALGMGFTNCVHDYEKYTQEELTKMGINDASIHVDFMIGSKDLNIVGYTRDGKKVQIFKDGNWAF